VGGAYLGGECTTMPIEAGAEKHTKRMKGEKKSQRKQNEKTNSFPIHFVSIDLRKYFMNLFSIDT